MKSDAPGGGAARLSSRAASAQRTQTAIVRAAAVLFDEYGYGATTLKGIAEKAGVSVETVGLAGPKRRLLRAAFDMAFAGNRASFPASGEPAYIAMTEARGFETAVGEYARLLAHAIARTAGIWSAFQAAADVDPRAAILFEEVRHARRSEFRRTAQWLCDQGIVAEESVAALVQEFFLIASHEVFLLLRAEFGYTPEMFASSLEEKVTRLLADPQKVL